MAENLEPGDKVRWDSHGGDAVGHVQREITEDMKIKGHQVRASEDDPQYLIESDKSGGLSAHRPETLDKVEE